MSERDEIPRAECSSKAYRKAIPMAASIDRRSVYRATFAFVGLLGLTRFFSSMDSTLHAWFAQIGLQAALIAGAWALAKAGSPGTTKERLGLGPSRLPPRLRLAVVLVSCLLVVVMWTLFDGPSRKALDAPFAIAWVGYAAIFLSLVVLPSICEELFFRGALQRWLTPRIGVAGAIGIGSLLFASLHASGGCRAVVFAGTFGLCLGALTHRSRSIREAIAIHALVNATYFASQFA